MKTALFLKASVLVMCMDNIVASISWHFEGSNIALHKNTSQRPGTYKDYNNHLRKNMAYPASLAVDNNKDNDFNHGSCSHTSVQHSSNASWTVDLGISYYIYGIIIYNRIEEKQRLKNFKIYGIYGVGDHRNLLYNDNNQHQYNKNITTIPLNPTHKYRNITVLVPNKQYGHETILTLCEVQIFGDEEFACKEQYLLNGQIQLSSGNRSEHRISRGTILSFSCQQGYRLQGASSSTCLWNGSFSESFPHCVLVCKVPSVQNGSYHNNSNLEVVAGQSVAVGEIIYLECSKGFEVEGEPELECIYGNDAIDQKAEWKQNAVCKIVTCAYPRTLQHGYYVTRNGLNYTTGNSTFGTNIFARCNSGYKLNSGNDTRCCDTSGQWTGDEPDCAVVRCNHPGLLENSHYVTRNGSNYTTGALDFETYITVKCHTGFHLTAGNATRQCNKNGKWTGIIPICDPVQCTPPVIFENGVYITMDKKKFTYPRSRFGTNITALCNKGYKLASNDAIRSCNETGHWTGETPKCDIIKCNLPGNIANASFEKLNKSDVPDKLNIGSSIRWKCNDNFLQSSGSEYQYCDVTGSWNGTTPVCVPVNQVNKRPLPVVVVIAGATSFGLIFVAVIVLVFIFKIRRRRAKENYADLKETRGGDCAGSDTGYSEINEISEGGQMSKSQIIYQNPTFSGLDVDDAGDEYYNFSSKTKMPDRAIPVARLSDVVLNGSVGQEMYVKQFESFSKSLPGNQTIGNKPENIKKNRYKNVFLYDDTRVVLKKSATGSDYINASYIHGFGKVNTYIATQGPLKGTLKDFWRMVWQTDSGKIVMLTNLVEQEKVKCEQYWPDGDTSWFGDIQVRFDKADVFAEFTIRKFSIKKGNAKEKLVKQFHFTTWPDKGVTKYASSLVHFWNKVKHVPTRARGPIIVHCSAGVGRTGTFIALDYLVDQARALDYVDVAGCVETLRRQRPHLVQTLDQYIFVHHTLVEALMLSTSALPAAQFPESYRQLLQTDPITRKRNLSLAFETLKKMSPVPEESQYVSAKQVKNRKKNRYPNILPVADYTPSLGSPTSSSNQEYINAVFLPTYKEQRAFIVTQMPLQQTIPDFWRLIYQHKIHTVVMLNHVDEAEESEIYWPEGDEMKEYTNIKIKNIGSEMSGDHRIVQLEMTYLKKTRTIQQFQFGGWLPASTLPSDTADMLRMMDLVQAWQRQSGNHTILVHCMNGAERSGLYCVISAVLERMKVEQDVAISHVIEEMRNRREQIIPTEEQFQFCHEAVLAFLEQNDTYSNFAA